MTTVNTLDSHYATCQHPAPTLRQLSPRGNQSQAMQHPASSNDTPSALSSL
eukprot:CAMPEP_0197845438 /NCGR_PEP_ID=MMETSP1438-20131217/2373_1 /TAXON_ID=1461541 /ORGANISM="Pterosperma sp., Strain CCMP1384" /LENGTH=50 /DNA_ID=CAMNT_0043456737 /DNA_START=80 /DNA_END=229 /DNA_ORIENTATION=-